jgi:hypothetical protein
VSSVPSVAVDELRRGAVALSCVSLRPASRPQQPRQKQPTPLSVSLHPRPPQASRHSQSDPVWQSRGSTQPTLGTTRSLRTHRASVASQVSQLETRRHSVGATQGPQQELRTLGTHPPSQVGVAAGHVTSLASQERSKTQRPKAVPRVEAQSALAFRAPA